jgi:hypothetical protein
MFSAHGFPPCRQGFGEIYSSSLFSHLLAICSSLHHPQGVVDFEFNSSSLGSLCGLSTPTKQCIRCYNSRGKVIAWMFSIKWKSQRTLSMLLPHGLVGSSVRFLFKLRDCSDFILLGSLRQRRSDGPKIRWSCNAGFILSFDFSILHFLPP